MAVAPADRKRVTSELKEWLDDVAAYERAFKQWEGRVEKILKRYRDDPRTGKTTWTEARFNILWSNVQTLSAATFSRLPKPDVSRRFRDQDPVGRVAANILERSLEYHVQHYPEYRASMKQCVLDRFLGARGTAWIRYEPHFRASGEATDGDQITEDVDTPDEELDYECVAVDYVHWKDFGHSVARTWEEVNRVWRKVYMTKDMLEERFGKQMAALVPLDADPRQTAPDKAYGAQDQRLCATVFEGWDKAEKKAVWFSKSVKDFLDEKDDPLGLEDVFPCPPPLYGTLTNDSLVPVPDFTLYQDQQNQLDLLADRIDGLVKALKVCGGYDASVPELQRIFTESENGTLIPIKNWQAFAEKNGLVGAVSLVDLNPIAAALQAAYEAFEQVKQQIYEITGISDIIRGQTQASETATAQQIKGQYASLRLKAYQNEVSEFASGILSLMGQVICRKFSPQTIAKIGGADQFPEADQQYLAPAMTLLVGPERMQNPDAEEGPNPVREFRIEVAADSMVHLDEQAEQQARTEFLAAVGTYLQNVATSLQGVPQPVSAVLIPLLMDMLKFGVTGYRVGKTVEGAFDGAAEKLKQIASAPPAPPPPPPEIQVAQIKAQSEGQIQQNKQQSENQRMAAEIQAKDVMHQREIQAKDVQHQREIAAKDQQHQREMMNQHEQFAMKLGADQSQADAKLQSDNEIQSKKIEASAKPQVTIDGKEHIQQAADDIRSMAQQQTETLSQAMQQMAQGMAALAQAMSEFKGIAKVLTSPKRIVRGPDGRAQAVETVQ